MTKRNLIKLLKTADWILPYYDGTIMTSEMWKILKQLRFHLPSIIEKLSER
jgi:hypothetical protein